MAADVDYTARFRRSERYERGSRVIARTNRGLEAAEVLALDEAMARLARASPRGARVVELRFFGGLTVEQIAELLEVSHRTVHRDWLAARAWLRQEVAETRQLENL